MCDRLSDLPDPLLLHILSFLPTKQAVAASFLSKRWRPLGHSFPILVIKDSHFSGREAFIQFVDYVLFSGESESLKTFGLECFIPNMPYDKINNWIDALSDSKVEHLEIWIPRTFNKKLPSSILNSSTIRILKFNGVTFGTLSSVNLPSLKVLHLLRVVLPDVNFLSMLLSGCALLEFLALSFLDDRNNYGPMQEIKKLNHLVAATVPPSLLPVKALSNVTFLRFEDVWSPGRRHAMWSPDADNFPTFDNLTHLECSAGGDWWTLIATASENSLSFKIL